MNNDVDKKISYAQFVAAYGKPFQFGWLAPLSLRYIDWLRLDVRLRKLLYSISAYIAILYGIQDAQHYTKMFVAQVLSAIQLIVTLFICMTLISGDVVLLLIALFIIIMLPYMLMQDLKRKVERRRRMIVMELPLFLNKIILLVNAGETIQQAIIRSAVQEETVDEHPFYKELHVVLKQLRNNYSFQQAMEELSRRCAVQEVSLLTNTIVLNYRRGGSELVTALRGLAQQLWMTRKNLAKTLGEEASAKLVFPLIIIFFIVIVIVGAPALMMLES